MSKRKLKKRIAELEQRVAALETRPIYTVSNWQPQTVPMPSWRGYEITC